MSVHLTERPAAPLLQWSELAESHAANSHDWLRAIRKAGWDEFIAQGIPTTKHEEWRYCNVRALSDTEYVPAPELVMGKEVLASFRMGSLEGYRLVFVNGRFQPHYSSHETLPTGVKILPLKQAIYDDEEIVKAHLGQYAKASQNPFVGQNLGLFDDGLFVHIAKNTVFETPIQIIWIGAESHATYATFPRNLIVLEENAQAKVLECYFGTGGTYFTNAVTELAVAESANLEHVKLQEESLEAIHIATIEGKQSSASTLNQYNVGFGAAIGRHDVNLFLDGEHCETRMDGVYLGAHDQVLDNHTRLDHAKPNCHSFEVYKGILAGRAIGVFNGKIFVHLDAQKTDAKQTNQALLLDPTATINTKPQLEIFADDVKCTHGATVGQIREDALFYLRARGIPEMEARHMLVYAFAGEVLDRISVPAWRDALEALLFDNLKEAHHTA